jgi:uncharacterized protein (DUF305 family)
MKKMIITITLFVLIALAVIGFTTRSKGTFKDVDDETNTAVIVKSFLDKMIPHHEYAITSSLKVMNDKDITESQVRIFAANVVDSQTFEIEKMKTIYMEYLGAEYAPTIMLDAAGTGMDHENMTSKTADLKGDELAKAYKEEMIAHHEGAVEMAKDYIKLIDKVRKESAKTEDGLTVSNNHPAIDLTYELAQQIVDTQEKEIEQLKSWN